MFSVKLNGTLAGFFGSTRGLRQGDPLSPFLFVLVMEMLSLKLKKETSMEGFGFHWKAKDCQLTHLLFADDILIFCKASLPSVNIINSCIQSFSLYSGLIPNSHKSYCYFSNTDPPTMSSILSVLGIQLGSLPSKFLGVPLLSRKLSRTDCAPLIQRITSRISSWTSHALAYSGRLQLIKSVLCSFQTYWCRHFMLPKAVLREVNSLLGRFLWKGSNLGKFGAKVAWSQITLPLNEGGLGIKSILDWNIALQLKHLIQTIHHDTTSLWAHWIQTTILKGKTIWQASVGIDCSWTWKQILKIRPYALQHLKFIIGDGNLTSLWYDPWLLGAPINPSISLISNSGIPSSAKVSHIMRDSSWNLPHSNHHDVIMLRQQILQVPFPPRQEDKILWGTQAIQTVQANQIWDSIRARNHSVPWSSILWHNLHVPRYSFMLWLGLLGRLSTNDRTKYYTGRTWNCLLCNHHMETFEHMFFECTYSSTILSSALDLGNWASIPHNWDDLISFLTNFQGSKLTKNILSLSVATCFYKVWEARNTKMHEGTFIPPRALAKDTINLIKSRISTSKVFLKATNCNYYCNWLVTH